MKHPWSMERRFQDAPSRGREAVWVLRLWSARAAKSDRASTRLARTDDPGYSGSIMRIVRQIFRHKAVPLIFLAAMIFLTARTCQSEFAQVELSFDFGAHAADVRGFRVDVFREGDDVSAVFFERAVDSGKPLGTPKLKAQLDAGTYRLLFEVTMSDGVRRFERVIETTDNAVITVNLERDLRP